MIAGLVAIIVILSILYVIIGVEVSKAAVSVAGQSNNYLKSAHKYLSWATSIVWISVGLIIIGFILLIILAIVGSTVILPEEAIVGLGETVSATLSSELKTLNKETESGFLGVQKFNNLGGFIGGSFKFILFGALILITGVGILASLALYDILKSGTDLGKDNTFFAVFLAWIPILLLIILEISNAIYVKNKKKKLDEVNSELRKEKEKLIMAQIESHNKTKAD